MALEDDRREVVIPTLGANTFPWVNEGGPCRPVLEFIEPGTYATVRTWGSTGFRILRTGPSRLGEAGGHAALACEEPVVFAGEIEVGLNNELVSWTTVSGTCQMPSEHVFQSLLPPDR